MTNGVAASAPTSGSTVLPDIIKELPRRIQELRAGATEGEAWSQLGLAGYKGHLGGESYPEKDRFWLAWNYELELTFEKMDKGRTETQGNPKLTGAKLFKNGLEIARSPSAGSLDKQPNTPR